MCSVVDGEEVLGTLEAVVRLVRGLSVSGDLGATAASTLRRLTSDGPQRLSELAAAESVSQPAMTQLIGRMQRDGLVRREGSPEDGRVVLVRATKRGRDAVAQRRRQRVQALQVLLDGLDEREQRAIGASLGALSRLVEVGDQGVAARLADVA
jgi:DNA-binding MarR family transcriptional regulator